MADGFFRLDGKVAMVTGGGQGIGEAICRRLAAAGAKVAVFDLSQANADKVAKSLNGLAVVGSVTSEADVQRIVKEVETKCGSLDIIVNNGSVAGKEGNPTMGPYSASKAAIIALTKSMAKEVVGHGDITINSISPAVIHTPILDGCRKARSTTWSAAF